MKRLVLAPTVPVLMPAAIPAAAQQPDEPARIPTLDEIELAMKTQHPPVVTIDPYEDRRALQEMIDFADDDDMVVFYHGGYGK